MAFLIALALLVAFSAALLHPYGRKLLLVMLLVVAAIVGLVFAAAWLQDRQHPPRNPAYAPAATY